MDSNAVFKVNRSTSSIHCFAFIAMLIWGSILSGQTLSDDPDQFVPEFTKLLNDMKTDAAKAVSTRFESLYTEGSLTPQMVAGFAEHINSMIARRMGPGTYMLPMASAINGAAGYGTSDQRYTEWLDIIDQMLMASQSPNNSGLKKWLLFSDKFFNNNYLYSSQSRVWEVEAEDYRFVMNGKKPEVFFPLLELVGSTTGDTIRILRARGTYKPLDYIWIGTQGRIDWQRADFDPSKVYADFRSHRISFKESDFQIDSAELTYAPVLTEKLIGSFKDKLVQNNNPSKTSYPKFRSYNNSTTNIELYPNVKYIGQFALEGYQFKGFGVKGNRAVLEFYNDKGELAVRAKTNDSFVDDRDRIHSSGAEVVIYFGEDSLYHPNIKLQFDQGYSDLTLTREEKGATSAPFFSSFHKLEYNPIQLVWNLEDTALYMKPRDRVGRKTADFSSVNLYDDPLYYMVQGPVSYHPLVAIKIYADATKRTVFGTLEIAQQFNRSLSIDGVQSLLYELMQLGFIYYDKSNEEVHMLDKTNNYVLANAERIDFDVIKMLSEPTDNMPNAVLNLSTGALKINGVFEINLSDSQFVKAFPSGKTLIVKENRDIVFGGTLFGGSSDFYGDDFEFLYDSFSVHMNRIDSMVMYSASGELDATGQPKLIPIQTAISGLSGILYIDNPNNKSGRENYAEYPIFKSSSPAFASYDKAGIHNNAYDEERFFFEVDEFRLDSLDSFDPANIGFSGTLKSDGIFPDITELLTVQEDNSMGFQTQTPADGLPLYDGVGRFTGDIGMSNDGLTGAGKIDYVTTELIGDRSYFFPDSAQGIIDSVVVRKQKGSTPFPEVTNEQVDMDWKPKADSLTLKMRTLPFQFFGGLTELEGSVTITPKELRGEGIMDWEEARATASDFSFGAMSMEADSAKFVIKSPIENRFALVLNNAYTNMDFENRKGVFRSNNRLEPTELPFNRYQTNINEFEWDIDGKSISFQTTGEEYSSFRSLSKRQDSLSFLAKTGQYNMEDHELQLEGVPYIAVGDAYIYPFEGKVVIEEDAIMQTLVNARIEFDSLSAFHEIKNAEIQIQGKYKMRGEGDYVYIDRLGEEQNIHFEDISSRQIISEYGDTIYETF
ncbi:MAG: hypothetical protein ACI959_001873, partial [Limisphaerales bacterium]